MATITLRRSDLFPVGTTVSIYPRGAGNGTGTLNAPRAAAIASADVDAAGLLTVTDAGILSYTDYVAGAQVSGEWRYSRVRSTLDEHGSSVRFKQVGTSWPATVTSRRTAAGTS